MITASSRYLSLLLILTGLSACSTSSPTSLSSSPSEGVALTEDSRSVPTTETLRVMAANLTSGNQQSYDPGEGIRIFQGLDPGLILIQEFNYGDNSPSDIREFVDIAFGPQFDYYREGGNEQIPNGVISRYPILQAGEWEDTAVSNRDYAWARIDVPGSIDLWAVSVHWLTDDSRRDAQAEELVGYVNSQVPSGDYLIVGGDFNTDNRPTSELTTLGQVVDTTSPYPIDQAGDPDTNAPRSKPYDAVYVDNTLAPLEIPVVIGSNSFTNGLVFDSRVYSPLSEVAPVQPGDSGAVNMQHMAVVRDFAFASSRLPGTLTVPGSIRGRLSHRDADHPNRDGRVMDEYRLTGITPGQTVQVTLDSPRFDAYLQLLHGVTERVMAENDNASGSNAAIEFTMTGSIPPIVRVTSAASGEMGWYEISAR